MYIPKDKIGSMFIVFGCMSVVALLLAMIFKEKVDWGEAIKRKEKDEMIKNSKKKGKGKGFKNKKKN